MAIHKFLHLVDKYCHLSKEAGMIKLPPVMEKRLKSAIVNVFAACQIAYIDQMLDFLKDWTMLAHLSSKVIHILKSKALVEPFEYSLADGTIVELLPVDDFDDSMFTFSIIKDDVAIINNTFKKLDASGNTWKIIGKSGRFGKQDIVNYVLTKVSNFILEMSERQDSPLSGYGTTQLRDIVIELEAQKRKLAKYTTIEQPEILERQKQGYLPLMLSGWEYLKGVDLQSFFEYLIDHNFTGIGLILLPCKGNPASSGKPASFGSWSSSEKIFIINVYNLWTSPEKIIDADDIIVHLNYTIEHELSHIAQTLLGLLKAWRQENRYGTSSPNTVGGLPKKTILNEKNHESLNPSQYIKNQLATEYELQDLEFYAHIKSVSIELKNLLNKLPNKEERQLVFDHILNLSDHSDIFLNNPNTFAAVLKEKNPRKYAKFVSEIRKELEPYL